MLQDNDARRPLRATRHREQRAHALLQQAVLVEDLHVEARRAGDGAGPLRKGLRIKIAWRKIDQLAGQVRRAAFDVGTLYAVLQGPIDGAGEETDFLRRSARRLALA